MFSIVLKEKFKFSLPIHPVYAVKPIIKARNDGVKFGRIQGSKNRTTPAKIEKIKIFLQAGKTYEWIAKELSVSRQTISDIKKYGTVGN